MPRTPSTTIIYKQLLALVGRMDAAEAQLKDLGVDVEKLKRWREDTEFAKRLLKEYENEHPEVKSEPLTNTAWKAVIGALVALTAVILATK